MINDDENHITTTETGVVFNLRNVIIEKAATIDARTANIVPSNRISWIVADSAPNKNSGFAMIITPVNVIVPVMICNLVNGSFKRK